MNKQLIILFLTLLINLGSAQGQEVDTALFDHFGIGLDSFLNDAGDFRFFEDQNIQLPNDYDPDFDAWQGWAISSMTDTDTRGFSNQYSAITGTGFFSDNYVVAGTFRGGSVVKFIDGPTASLGMMVTNSTYAYYSMLEGDAFAKRFGGESGNDPDFFLMSARAYYGDSLSTDSLVIYLADYRFEDNSKDFLMNQWTYFDLSPLGEPDSILLRVWSSDTGLFGINTPAYFCMDHFTYLRPMTTSTYEDPVEAKILGNPVDERIRLEWVGPSRPYMLAESCGKPMAIGFLSQGMNEIEVSSFPPGIYMLKIKNGPLYKILKR